MWVFKAGIGSRHEQIYAKISSEIKCEIGNLQVVLLLEWENSKANDDRNQTRTDSKIGTPMHVCIIILSKCRF